jgi:NitT/TauT family transport system substrate-binding protein
MTGQINIGWAVPPFALKELQEKPITIIARANEATDLKDQTIRVNLANVESLKSQARRDRALRVYDRTIEWSYADPKAIKLFCRIGQCPARDREASGRRVLSQRSPADREILGLELTLRDALQ